MRSAPDRRVGLERCLRTLLVLAAAAAVTGCVATTALQRPGLSAPAPSGTRVLLMSPDVELSEVTAAGLEEPNAQWTAQGRRHVTAALGQLMQSKKVILVPYREPEPGTETAHAHVQLEKLHEAVGMTILSQKFSQAAALPTKAGGFDWTLGQDAKRLREEFGADYALFVFLHDSYASGSRVAMIVALAAFGVVAPGGVQRGFASLVDLRNGDVAWFNVLVRNTGDLRTFESAADAVATLLTDVPL